MTLVLPAAPRQRRRRRPDNDLAKKDQSCGPEGTRFAYANRPTNIKTKPAHVGLLAIGRRKLFVGPPSGRRRRPDQRRAANVELDASRSSSSSPSPPSSSPYRSINPLALMSFPLFVPRGAPSFQQRRPGGPRRPTGDGLPFFLSPRSLIFAHLGPPFRSNHSRPPRVLVPSRKETESCGQRGAGILRSTGLGVPLCVSVCSGAPRRARWAPRRPAAKLQSPCAL